MPNADFEHWFAPLRLVDFRARYLGNSPFYAHDASDAIRSLVRTMGAWKVEDLLARQQQEVLAWFHTLDGRHTSARVSPAAARKLYDAGITLYLGNVPEVETVKEEVAAALHLPSKMFFGALFCNKPNAETRAHFDPVDIFCVQLRGSKRWWVAENQHAPLPLRNWATLDPTDPDLRLLTSDPPPTDIPEGAAAYDMAPGSLLYVPRGHWHKTFSDEESMSLHIGYSAVTNLEIILHALKVSLAGDRAFRESPYTFWDPSARGESIARLRQLLGRAAAVLAQVDAEDVVPTPANDAEVESTTRFVRNGLASVGVESWGRGDDDAAAVQVNVHGFPHTRVTSLELSRELAEATLGIASTTSSSGGVGANELSLAHSGIEAADAKELLGLLERAGLVRRTA